MTTPVNVVNVPTSGLGSPGDTKGMIAVEETSYGGKFYYCVKNYDGVSRIWVEASQLSGNPFHTFLLIPPPVAPVITSFSTTEPGASALEPIIRGTISNSSVNTEVSISARLVTPVLNSAIGVTMNSGKATVNGTNWSYQAKGGSMYPLQIGTWNVTATAMFIGNQGEGLSYSSSNSNTLSMTLSPPPPPLSPLPTLALQVVADPKGKVLRVSFTNATSISLNGTIAKGFRSGSGFLYASPTNGKVATYSPVIVATGPGGTTTKTITFTVNPAR